MNATTARDGRIPVTVIGGFLGSGKTTLLNQLLQRDDGRRLAVLVNDFGAINVDAALVRSRTAQVMSLANGCVCCQIGGDLGDALIEVLQRRPAPDAIVIEASGVADPWRIAQVSLADPMLALDGVVVMVDAASVREQADDPLLADTVLRQLQAADLLVVNQCDRIDEEALVSLRGWLDAQQPGTPRFETSFAQLPAALLGASLEPSARHATQGDPDHGAVFDTWSTSTHDEFVATALRALLHAMPQGVIRLKGVVRTAQGWSVLQFAGRHGSLRAWPATAAPPPVMQASSVVAIGAHGQLPIAALEAALHSARTQENKHHETQT